MIDTHTHIYSDEFIEDIDTVIERAQKNGVKYILLPNVDAPSLNEIKQTVSNYPGYCLPMYGLHPTSVDDNYKENLAMIFSEAECNGDAIAVGEIGLDLYWDKTWQEQQVKAFEWQIDYAQAHNLPMSIHCRNAYALLFGVLSNYDAEKIVGSLHCFSGTAEDAQHVVEKYPNLMFGFNGTLTYKTSHLRDILKQIPHNRILFETDAPYLSPIPHRGKRNEPSYLTKVAACAAEVLSLSTSEIEKITDANAIRLFRLEASTDK